MKAVSHNQLRFPRTKPDWKSSKKKKRFWADFFEESFLQKFPKGLLRWQIQCSLCLAEIPLLNIILILGEKKNWLLQPVFSNFSGSEFMQHELLPIKAFKTKRNKVIALVIYYGVLSNVWLNFSNSYIFYVRKKRMSHERLKYFYWWFHIRNFNKDEKISWDEKEAGADLSPEPPLWSSLSVEMLDSK